MDEQLILRMVAYGSVVLGTVGLATTIGGWQAWVVVLAVGAVPSGYLLKRHEDDKALERDREKYAKPQQADVATPETLY